MELEFQNATIGSLKRYYKTPKIFFFKLDFEKIDFQKMDISLISWENEAKCCFFCPKRAFANFVQPSHIWDMFII